MFGFRRQTTVTVPEQTVNPPVVVREPQPGIDSTGRVVQPAPVVVQTVAAAPTVTETTVPSRWDQFRAGISDRVQDILWFIFSIAALLIIVRFCLIAFAVNSSSVFATDMLSWSAILVGPFLGLLPDPRVPNIAHFEMADVVALLVYGIVTVLACRVVALILSPHVPSRRVIVTRD